MVKYPVGLQTFSKIREEGYKYVDKTDLIYQLAETGAYYFLSRPRRFGKSLLLSTIQAYFEGRKELFEGLAIEGMEQKWETYPVLRFDFSGIEAEVAENFEDDVKEVLQKHARRYGVELSPVRLGPMLGDLIEKVAEKTGRGVVILVDEYDNSLLKVLENESHLAENQNLLQSFFTQIKKHDEYIRFVMITGVTRFRHLTLFSGFNNLKDISMDPKYAALCGITQQELENNFSEGLDDLEMSWGETRQEVIDKLRMRYDS